LNGREFQKPRREIGYTLYGIAVLGGGTLLRLGRAANC
jgi:hypothetical protein